jgi:ammonium transporter, Amt family
MERSSMIKYPRHLFPLLGMALAFAGTPAIAAEPGVLDTGNTAWILVSSALVMLMTPGLAFFYAGMVNHKNVVSTLLQSFMALSIIGLLWIFVGYSLVFTEGSSVLGGLDNILLTGLAGKTYGTSGVPMLAFVAFQMMFAIITPALITGSIAERVHFKAWILILALWSLVVYVPVAHWVWGPGGWIASLGGLDFAGGLVVHITSGFSGLVAALLFGRRVHKEHAVPNDIPMIMLGAALLWFGWFGFNAGSAIASDFLAAHAFMTTFIGGAMACASWVLVDWLRSGKPSAVGAACGIVAGLVAITPAAGFVTIEAAFIIAAIAGVVCNMLAHVVKKISHLDDALDVFACHGIGGVIGAILTGAFASKAVNPVVAVEGILVSGETGLFMANLIGTVAVAGFAMVATFVIIKLVNMFTPIRVSDEHESRGLDASIHGEIAKVHA